MKAHHTNMTLFLDHKTARAKKCCKELSPLKLLSRAKTLMGTFKSWQVCMVLFFSILRKKIWGAHAYKISMRPPQFLLQICMSIKSCLPKGYDEQKITLGLFIVEKPYGDLVSLLFSFISFVGICGSRLLSLENVRD